MTKQLSALIHVLVKIDTALYLISTQRNLAVVYENISMPLNPDFYGRMRTSHISDYAFWYILYHTPAFWNA